MVLDPVPVWRLVFRFDPLPQPTTAMTSSKKVTTVIDLIADLRLKARRQHELAATADFTVTAFAPPSVALASPRGSSTEIGAQPTSLIAYGARRQKRRPCSAMPSTPETIRAQRKLGVAVKTLRSAAAITQEELSSRTGLHPTYVSDIERGARNPSFAVLVRIVDGLGITLAELGETYDRLK